MFAVTGYEVFLGCRKDVAQVFTLDRCPADSVIYIASITAGHSNSVSWNDNYSQCYLGTNVSCHKTIYRPEIMRCNGRRNCTFTPVVFDHQCERRTWYNFIDIKYYCVDGKKMCFFDSPFRCVVTIYTTLYDMQGKLTVIRPVHIITIIMN